MELILSFIVAFAVTFVAGKLLIPVLRRLKAGQSIKEIGPTWHKTKEGTPTMGGLTFIVGIGVASLILGWRHMMAGETGHLIVFAFALVFGVIGFIDDFVKVKKQRNTGLNAVQKFLLQVLAALVFTVLLRHLGYLSPTLYVPFFHTEFTLPWGIYLVFAAFVMVGTVNAVNITDGVDGLATGVTMPVALFYTAVSAFWGYSVLGVFSAAVFGGLSAFLIFNFHPAKVFMGDTGSLFLGGVVCGMAFALDVPLALIPVGIIYIAETMSDIIQVVYFKLTHGKRIFRMAPLHHHFEMCGWSEEKLFCVFSGITIVACVATFFGVMNRYSM